MLGKSWALPEPGAGQNLDHIMDWSLVLGRSWALSNGPEPRASQKLDHITTKS